MNLYHLSQDENMDYDTFDSCIVCAESEDAARRIYPRGPCLNDDSPWESGEWASCPENVRCKLIGTAAPGIKEGVVLASFNAG